GAASLGALELVTPAGAEQTSFTIAVSAPASEGGLTAVAATSFGVTLGAVAEAPNLSVGGVSSPESGGAALSLALSLSESRFDGDDTLGTLTLSGVPAGWSFSGDGAASVAPGVWVAGAASLGALELVTPAGAEQTSFTIAVSAPASEGGLTAVAATSFGVTLGAVAEAPNLSAGGVASPESGG